MQYKSRSLLAKLIDIAGDFSVQIDGVLINALAGVETTWVETIDYLADTWSVFVAKVKSMWDSIVSFLRKAWIKLKSLFYDDVNVEVEMAKIDKEIRTTATLAFFVDRLHRTGFQIHRENPTHTNRFVLVDDQFRTSFSSVGIVAELRHSAGPFAAPTLARDLVTNPLADDFPFKLGEP